MAALIPGFEHDIFISYRHNDEKWMADFITELQGSIRAVIGKELSIYYDRDVKNGLKDNYQVRESLDHRVLNSFILMPLISATYCDTEKYSWNYEFLPFLEQAKNDRLGLDITLPNKNVSSRIIPLRTYELEAKHSQLLQQTLGGFMRSIDFVYLAQGGVNRPLRMKDEDLQPPTTNGLNYLNQMNILVNAIKELLEAAMAMAQPVSGPVGAAAALAGAAAPVATVATAPASAAAAPTGPKVFLAWTTTALKARREELALVCTKAGLNVVAITDCPTDEEEFRKQTQAGLEAADCSLHLLGNGFGKRFAEEPATSFPMYAYNEARQKAAGQPTFQQFVWYSPDADADVDKDQEAFVSKIRNELTAQCTFSSAPNAQQVVEDLRSTLVQVAPPPVSEVKENDICLISSALDGKEADAIAEQLCDEYGYNVNSFTIASNNEEQYKKKTVHAIAKSRLAVVYFKHSVDWALPFVNQVYQLVGGASSPTPILYLGEDEPEENGVQKVRAKNLKSSILPHQGVSEEVKRVFQQVNSIPA